MNIVSKLLFALSFFLFASSHSELWGMDTKKPLYEQNLKKGYQRTNFLPLVITYGKNNPKKLLGLCFSEYKKPIQFRNITWFKHIYRTKDQCYRNQSTQASTYRQKKIITDAYELVPNAFTKFFIVGACALPCLYNCFWK